MLSLSDVGVGLCCWCCCVVLLSVVASVCVLLCVAAAVFVVAVCCWCCYGWSLLLGVVCYCGLVFVDGCFG